jgi:hypothetical protein
MVRWYEIVDYIRLDEKIEHRDSDLEEYLKE